MKVSLEEQCPFHIEVQDWAQFHFLMSIVDFLHKRPDWIGGFRFSERFFEMFFSKLKSRYFRTPLLSVASSNCYICIRILTQAHSNHISLWSYTLKRKEQMGHSHHPKCLWNLTGYCRLALAALTWLVAMEMLFSWYEVFADVAVQKLALSQDALLLSQNEAS